MEWFLSIIQSQIRWQLQFLKWRKCLAWKKILISRKIFIFHVYSFRFRSVNIKHSHLAAVHVTLWFAVVDTSVVLFKVWWFCWIRVLTKSKGWNKMVLHVPETEPATNDLTMGLEAIKSAMALICICFHEFFAPHNFKKKF